MCRQIQLSLKWPGTEKGNIYAEEMTKSNLLALTAISTKTVNEALFSWIIEVHYLYSLCTNGQQESDAKASP